MKPESSRSRRASYKNLGQKPWTDGLTHRQIDRHDQILSRSATKKATQHTFKGLGRIIILCSGSVCSFFVEENLSERVLDAIKQRYFIAKMKNLG